MIELPEKFLERMKNILGDKFGDFLSSYEKPAVKGIRVNTLKGGVEDFKKVCPFALKPVPWEQYGFITEEEKAGKTVLHAAGAYYVQEPSAMCAAPLLDVQPGEKVLDMCSAPGGKGTQMAQRMCGEGLIVLNEINLPRAKILSSNVERLGVRNAVVTCASPSDIQSAFGEYFEKVLVDAPCSGEGMFRKEPNAVAEWSEENVSMCARRQSLILDSAAGCVKAGGRLVYSTCTFAPEEDELQTAAFLSRHPEFSLITQKKLYPHEIIGEGHFAALFIKNQGGESELAPLRPRRPDKNSLKAYADFAVESLSVRFDNIYQADNMFGSLPKDMPELHVHGLREGISLADGRGTRFVPSHALAMCLTPSEARFLEIDEATALKYLGGNAFDCGDVTGWRVVSYMGYPLGWCKCVGGVAKNHLPKGVRI